MSHLEFSLLDPDSIASTDESAPPPVPMAPMSKRKFTTDSGDPGGSWGTALSRYKGIRYLPHQKKWAAEIRPKGSKFKIGLGMYSTPLEAAFTSDVAVTCLGDRESKLNFLHPIYRKIPQVSPDLSPQAVAAELKKVVKEFEKLARDAGYFVDSTASGGCPGGSSGTSRDGPDLCPECGKTFLSSQSMLDHLMYHWSNQKFSPPPQSSRGSGGASRSPGMDSRWWLMYKGVRYWEVDIDAPELVATHNEDLAPWVDDWEAHDRWAAWVWLPHGDEISLGLYSTSLEAAYAYDVAITCLGSKPLLNFRGHPIYEQIPRIFPNLSPQSVVEELKKVVNEFKKLTMEVGDSRGLKQEMTLKEFLEMSPSWKSIGDEDMIFRSFPTDQQASDSIPFQKKKRHCFNDKSISCADGNSPEHLFPNEFNDETMEGISESLEAHLKMLEMLPPDCAPGISYAWPTIEPSNTRIKQPYHPVSLGHDMQSMSTNGALKFTMDDLNIITRNFSESLLVGQGSSGSVYQGQLQDGTTVVVKRIKKDDMNLLKIEEVENFQTEAHVLSKAEHVNLVKVLGFHEDESEQILVMEYITNGNLRQHLDGIPDDVILDMSKRCRISLDVVAALRHLDNQTKDDLHIIYKDIKSSDILITDDFRAKVVGFGLSQHNPLGDVGASSSSTQVKETSEYMALEHLTTHHLKEQNDVYSFGELLVEIFTGKRFIKSSLPSDECFTPRWVLKQCVEGRLKDIIDPKITPTTLNLKILDQIFMLVISCLALEENNQPTIEDVFWDLSFIVGHFFGDLKDESKFKGIEHEVQEEQEWDPKACNESNLQTLCLEESEVLEGQKWPSKHLNVANPSNSSFIPTKPHGSVFVEDLESGKVQTSTQLDTQFEADSPKGTRQALKLSIANQDQSSLLLTSIIPDVFQLKSDETYFEMLQEEIEKISYISRLLSQGDDFEQNLTITSKTIFFLYFNEKDNVFEFYFKNYQGMASIVGVGLEYAKVVLEDGWRVTIQEIPKPNWDDAWKNFVSSSSTVKVTIPEPLEEGMDSTEDSQEALASIPRGQCLLLDLAQYFILNKAIASFLPKASMAHANTDSSTSSSPNSQDIARSSSSSDQKPSAFLQAMKNIFISREANQFRTKNGNGIPMGSLGDDDVKIDTTVHLKLLPGGCLYDGSNLLDATISNDKELEELTSQLDNTICLEMMFKFLNEDDKKEIQVIVGPISFQFQEENETNYERIGRYGWYHKLLEVSFGPVDARCSKIGPNHKALDTVDWIMSKTIGSSNATAHGSSKSMNGGVTGSLPQILALSSEGSLGWSNSTCESTNVGDSHEKPFQMTIGGFDIFSKRYQLSSTLRYAYRTPDYMYELDHGKLPCEDYRKLHLNLLPMCSPQDVKFEGTWYPKDLDYNAQVLAEYSLITSRLVHMTSKEISKKVVKKSWMKRCGHPKIQKGSNEPLKYTQKYARSIFLNHAMTHLNGEQFKVEEFLHQRPLNQREPETHLKDYSHYAPQWQANPLVGLNSEIDYQL